MDVRVRVPTQLRDLVAGSPVVDVEVPDIPGGFATVEAVLDGLADAYPALERRIRDEQGRMRPHVNLFVGSDNVRDREGPETLLTAADELSIIPAVSGG
jgi:molybdopterin converting factor small subunit